MGASEKHIIHPTIRKCLQHLDIIEADEKTKQLVYMYMETLFKEITMQYECPKKHILTTKKQPL